MGARMTFEQAIGHYQQRTAMYLERARHAAYMLGRLEERLHAEYPAVAPPASPYLNPDEIAELSTKELRAARRSCKARLYDTHDALRRELNLLDRLDRERTYRRNGVA